MQHDCIATAAPLLVSLAILVCRTIQVYHHKSSTPSVPVSVAFEHTLEAELQDVSFDVDVSLDIHVSRDIDVSLELKGAHLGHGHLPLQVVSGCEFHRCVAGMWGGRTGAARSFAGSMPSLMSCSPTLMPAAAASPASSAGAARSTSVVQLRTGWSQHRGPMRCRQGAGHIWSIGCAAPDGAAAEGAAAEGLQPPVTLAGSGHCGNNCQRQ